MCAVGCMVYTLRFFRSPALARAARTARSAGGSPLFMPITTRSPLPIRSTAFSGVINFFLYSASCGFMPSPLFVCGPLPLVFNDLQNLFDPVGIELNPLPIRSPDAPLHEHPVHIEPAGQYA